MIEKLLRSRYKLLKPLGQGGFAKTYLAVDCQQDSVHCVIKHLTPVKAEPEFLTTARRLFESEAAALQRLGTHDRIPSLLDAFESEGEFYLVQEFIDGNSLSTLFKQHPRYTEAEIIALLEDILPILAFIHEQEVVHRDIKPSNLMRRHADGRFMLIDFGAVKAITTEFYTAGSEQLTVSIGTQGYAAPEQMAGRPRYSSDLYSLGMTVIRGLTGRSPTELPENRDTGELLWESAAPTVSPGLRQFLQRLTEASVYQRYPSAAAALADLAQLDTLAAPLPPDLPETQLKTLLPPAKPAVRRRFSRAFGPLLVTAAVLVIRQLGGWAPLELMIYDRWTQWQPALPQDDRLLVVEITEADLKALQQSTPSDAILSQAIQTLQAHNPRVIGIDLYRDIPQGEGQAALLKTLAADNIITIRQLDDRSAEAIPAPPGLPPERVGFNDFPVDDDGVVRRSLLMASADERPETEVLQSLALRLALAYLEPEGILPLASEARGDHLTLNGTTFTPLAPQFGGYHRADTAGYQLMLQYRAADAAVPQLSLSAVLAGDVNAAMVRDRIVLIGTTAASAKDLFLTPYSAGAEADFLMPGVMLHAQATSQIITAALDERPLRWALPEVGELVWIGLWAIGGTVLGGTVKRRWVFSLGLVGGSLVLVGLPAAMFMAEGWLPLLPASAVFGGTAIAAVLSRQLPAPHQYSFTNAKNIGS
ncbi:MAG: CHASE2 domain-containing protein [Leptolyngbyaceae cyanobacterium]